MEFFFYFLLKKKKWNLNSRVARIARVRWTCEITRKAGHWMQGIWSHINATKHLEKQPNFYWVRYFPVLYRALMLQRNAESTRWISHVLATISRRAHDNSRGSGLLIIFLDFRAKAAREARMDEEAPWVEDRTREGKRERERAGEGRKKRARTLITSPFSWREMNN